METVRADAGAASIGQLGIGYPKLPADLVAIREMAGELRTLSLVEPDDQLSAFMSRLSDRISGRSERFVLVDREGAMLFNGRWFPSPEAAVEHAAHVMGGEISSDGYSVREVEWTEDGPESFTLAEVLELQP